MKTRSLSRSTVLTVLAIESLCAVAFSGTSLWYERREHLRALDVTIQGRSDSLIGAVQDSEDPQDNVFVDPAELILPSNDVFAVYNLGGRLLGSSRKAPVELIARGADGFRDITVCHHSYRVLQREAMRIIDRAETGGVGRKRPVTVLYAVPTDRIGHEIFEAARFYVLLSLGLLCATAVVLIFLLRRLLTPLEELAVEAAGVKAKSLDFNPPSSALRLRELKPLAEALSDTIARLRLAFEMEQRFFSDAAHELKTAVAVVRSTVQVLSMRTRSQEDYRRGLDQVLADNERVEDLVARMLTLARFEEPQGANRERTDLCEAAQTVIRNLQSFAETRGVALNSSLAEGTRAPLSPEAAQVLITNLVMNAIQHSPDQAEVQVIIRLASENHNTATLEVRDSGTGIAPESLPHVFERFYREDRSRSRETGGAGLGLAICKSIADAAGGAITIDSAPGRGTTVTVSFMLA